MRLRDRYHKKSPCCFGKGSKNKVSSLVVITIIVITTDARIDLVGSAKIIYGG